MTTDKFEFRIFQGPFAGVIVNLEVAGEKIVAVELRTEGQIPQRHALDGDTVQVMNTTFTIGMPVEEVESDDIEVIHTLVAIKGRPQHTHHDLLTGV